MYARLRFPPPPQKKKKGNRCASCLQQTRTDPDRIVLTFPLSPPSSDPSPHPSHLPLPPSFPPLPQSADPSHLSLLPSQTKLLPSARPPPPRKERRGRKKGVEGGGRKEPEKKWASKASWGWRWTRESEKGGLSTGGKKGKGGVSARTRALTPRG